jgi:hypothetical protein
MPTKANNKNPSMLTTGVGAVRKTAASAAPAIPYLSALIQMLTAIASIESFVPFPFQSSFLFVIAYN